MKFSFIVPVYNVAPYLNKCLQSLLEQDYNDYEIILVDDCSTDESSIICEKYARDYEIVKCFHHKENKGLSEARNTGIRNSKGEYLIFVDSDDWIDKKTIKSFLPCLKENPDVLETCLVKVGKDLYESESELFEQYLQQPFDNERFLQWVVDISKDTWPSVKRVVKAQFIWNNHLQFRRGFFHEDVDWSYNLVLLADSVAGCSFPWYFHWTERKDSITHKIHAKNICDVIETAALHFSDYASNEEKRIKLFCRLMFSVYSSINKVKYLNNEEEIDQIALCINKNRNIFKCAPHLKFKFFVLIMKVLGIKRTLLFLSAMGSKLS